MRQIVSVTVGTNKMSYGPFRNEQVAKKWARDVENLGRQEGLFLQPRLTELTEPQDPFVTTQLLLRL